VSDEWLTVEKMTILSRSTIKQSLQWIDVEINVKCCKLLYTGDLLYYINLCRPIPMNSVHTRLSQNYTVRTYGELRQEWNVMDGCRI